MEKITPISIQSFSPRKESVLRASRWFSTERMELDKPDEGTLAWHFAQGWTVDSKFGDKYKLSRRVLKTERALNDLIKSYTNAYNDGRRINSQRYDELVALYTAMLAKTENELANMGSDDDPYKALVDDLLAAMLAAQAEYKADVDGALDSFGNSMRTQTNTRFDNQLSSAQQDLISQGLYNTTVWASVSTGIGRERSLALNDLEDKISIRQVDIKHRVYQAKADVYARILAARDRLRDQLQNAPDRRVALRNAVMNGLLQFMERRQDEYPDMAAVGNLATQMGAASPPGGYVPTSGD